MRYTPSNHRFFSRACCVVVSLLLLGLLGWAHVPERFALWPRAARLSGRVHTLLLPSLGPSFLTAQESYLFEPDPRRHPKLSTPLADLARAVPQQRGPAPEGAPAAQSPLSRGNWPKSVRDAVRTQRMRINKDDEVQVYIEVREMTDANLEELRMAGATIELKDEAQRIVQAEVPLARLEQVAELPFVRLVRLPKYGIRHTGSVTTEGDAILKADQVRSLLHVDGTGVRVGVISDGINGIFATGCTTCGGVAGGPIATLDLPQATGTRTRGVLISATGGITAQSFDSRNHDLEGTPIGGCAFAGAGAEGTALLEIVHDLAPGARLFFANFSTSLEFNQAVNFLASQADIVVDDIGFLAEPYDGTSVVSTNTANALNNSSNPIRAYFTSVGNFARSHYQSDFVDSGMDGTSIVRAPGNLHRFQATADTSDILGLGPTLFDKILLPAGGEVVIVLTWNDPFSSSTNDYDLFLVQESTGMVVDSSTNRRQTSDPIEFIDYQNNRGVQDFFHILIQNARNLAAVKNLNMYVFQPECAAQGPAILNPPNPERHNYNTVRDSIIAESDAGGSPVSVISVGAIRASDPGNVHIEFFSSQGPTFDGRVKPDVSGIDGVSVTGAGMFVNPFFGTSAAAPHGAGIAALLLQAAPCLVSGAPGARGNVDARTILRGLVLNSAVGLGSPVPNNVFGFGRIDALAAANRLIPTASAGSNRTVSGNVPSGASVVLDGSASSDPTACPLTYNWTGSCGTGTGVNASVTCPFGTDNLTLTVSNNGVTVSPPSSVQITVTDFSVGVSPASATVRAGQAANYNVTVSPLLGPFGSPITLGCSNLPPATVCNFSPAALTPGANPLTSMLTVSTTAPSAALRWPFASGGQKPLFGVWITALGLALAGFLIARRRLRLNSPGFYLWLCLVVSVLGLLGACGGNNSPSPPPPNGTPPGTYSLAVTGTAGSLPHSMNASLIVQ